MDEKTNVMRILDQKKVKYTEYTYLNTDCRRQGCRGFRRRCKQLLKRFNSRQTGNHYVFLVPVNKELSLKKAAKAVGEKKVEMIKSKELLPLTGYIHGGCSPIGMKKFFKTTIHESAKDFDTIMFSGGKIGYQVETTLDGLKKVIRFDLCGHCE
ncbi:MAG: aminoacyl-tRNA deacylase [Eubacterium sp.]